jgi:hypothetical protein
MCRFAGHVSMKTALHALALCVLTVLPVFSQEDPTVNRTQSRSSSTPALDYETAHLNRVATAVRTTEAIVIDGRLDEPAWGLAAPAADFVQKVPVTGRPETERTEVRFLYDSENLYIGVMCFDSDVSGITINDLEYDFSNRGSDNIHIALDSLHERRSSFTFRTNPAGAKADLQVLDGTINGDWDAVWDVRTSINDEGWIAEFVVPFKTLRFSTGSTQVWGLQMTRKIIRKSEETYWSPVPVRYGLPRTSIYGTLEGLEDITPGLNLKVTPFVTAGTTQLRPAATSGFTTRRDVDGGFDLKYSATPSLTLDATFRTDFAQVEVDQQQVNLTRFSLFFPEKRDFFIENARTFAFGAGTNLVPFFSRRIGLSPVGTPVPIVGGARLSGRAGAYEVGVIGMQTERSGAIPPNSFLVGRIKRNLWANSWIGTIGTNRDSTLSGDFNRVYGADAHLEFYDRLLVDSHILQSETPGLSGQNHAKQLEMAWRDDEVTLAAGYNELQPNFNPEMGFMRRGNNTRYSGNGSWNPIIETSDVIRNLTFGTSVEYYETGGTGEIETRAGAMNLGVDFENNATISFVATDTFDRLVNPFAIRPDIAIAPGDYSYLDYSAQAASNPGRRIAGNATVEWGEFWDGDRTSVRGSLDVKPNHHLSLTFNYQRDHVELPVGQFTANLAGARVRYAFTPRAFLASFFQYNWTTRQLSSNVRFNLIHRPLSDLFVVYNDIRDASGRSLQRALILKLTNLIEF